jgi:hypothetical protein
MASYATALTSPSSTVASPSFNRGVETDVQKKITSILATLDAVTTVPDSLVKMLDTLRGDMESVQGAVRTPGSSQGQGQGSRFGNTNNFGSSGGMRNFQGGNQWRSMGSSASRGPPARASAFDTRPSPRPPPTAKPLVGRYQSRFKTEGDLNDKILNTVIGNKLNSFTASTYSDTRDFIYQIMDSGETEFIKDFIEKVFSKATVEELYCALFAKLIAEIAHRYPIMYDEMRRYHQEFLKVFEDVDEGVSSDTDMIIRRRLYRLGYGQFISELAGNNALEKEQLIAMVSKVIEKVWILTAEPEKTKVVEEFIDCLVRLTKSLVEKSPSFFATVKGDMRARILEQATQLIEKKAGARPSFSTKARFGLMDLKDLL